MNKPWLSEERKNKAKEWDEYIRNHFFSEIEYAIYKSRWDDGTNFENIKLDNVEIIEGTTDDGIILAGDSCCVLNFASYTSPGGGFLKGAYAQEECLCNSSNLYQVLSADRFAKGYAKHKKTKHDGLYSNWSIWTPGILYFAKNKVRYEINVFTCAAPNKTEYLKRNPDSLNKYNDMLLNRIDYVLEQMYNRGERTLVLGAFGCGVFGNDPLDVADCFRYVLDRKFVSENKKFDKVIFAIPRGKNLDAFRNVFGIHDKN